MLTRRDLLVALAVTITPLGVSGTQGEKQQPSDDQLTTVTLIIDGMT